MTERKFIVNGLRLNCVDYGGAGKPPLLFIHGGSAHGHWWDFVGPHFADRFHALAIDLRGHGDSEWPEQWEYGTRHYVADLDDLIDNWGLGAPVLVGHSMGGHNAMVYASRYPEKLRAMVAIDSPADYPERAVEMLHGFSERPGKRFKSLAEAIANFRLLPRETLATPEVLRHAARYTFRQTPEGEWIHKIDRRATIREPINLGSDLGKITCPALYVKALKSPFPTVEQAQKIAAMMPRGQFAALPDSYHHAMFDNPAGLIAILNEFLRGIN
ncbi:MAG TPA: alpha/beta hydrolase [Candidatus Binataceae bacterium]|nr:alpha/beta hydrolase [Candidatus Binataceae bacterium]